MVPDWVLREAEKQCGWDVAEIDNRRDYYNGYPVFRALCDMILKHEQPPVDPIEAAAREGCAQYYDEGYPEYAEGYRDGSCKVGADEQLDCAIAAIKVWIERGEGIAEHD